MKEIRNAHTISVGKPEGKNHLEDLSVNGMITLKWILRDTGYKGVDWIKLAQDSVYCHALMKKVRKTLGSIKARNF
jgi:hypothetical protein